MKSVGIKELKNHLSSYLDSVKNGETIVILDRNHPIAEIKKMDRSKSLVDEYVSEAVKNHSIVPAKKHANIRIPKSLALKGKSKESIQSAWKKLYNLERE